jgi:hypothetical protein
LALVASLAATGTSAEERKLRSSASSCAATFREQNEG